MNNAILGTIKYSHSDNKFLNRERKVKERDKKEKIRGGTKDLKEIKYPIISVDASAIVNKIVCGDSEEVVVSNKSGGRNPAFKYFTGAIENLEIRDEIIEVLEGGKDALAKRRDKLGLSTL